jgi:hypothetical protein
MGKLRRPELPPGPLDELVRELHALHTRAGRPSTREMARGQSFSYTVVHDLFTKTVTEPPKLPVLLKVVEGLATLAPRTNVDETLDNFDALWRAANDKPFEEPTAVAELKIERTPLGKLATNDAPAVREQAQLTREEQAVLEQMAQGKVQQDIRWELEEMPLQHYSRVEASLYYKLGVSGQGRADLVARARALGFLEPERRHAGDPSPMRLAGRAMTKELFFLAGSAAPLHDAAAELRRAGYLVRDQPHDLDGTWSLKAYSAASELTDKDLATLDGIAETCGVEFDGWGTYVGPPHMDDGPGKPLTKTEPLFSISGEVLTTPEAVNRMHNLGVGRAELVKRHMSGDWGEISAADAEANDHALRTGDDQIMSGYGQGERRLLVITEADRSVTTILTPEDL